MKLDKKFKKAWVKALLSEEFVQTDFYDRDGSYCVLEVGAIVKFGNREEWQRVFEGVEDAGLIREEFWLLNDNDQLPFEIFAGMIDEWL